MPPIPMAARLKTTPHITVVVRWTTMPGNTVTAQQTKMLHIAKVARQNTATPIGKMLWSCHAAILAKGASSSTMTMTAAYGSSFCRHPHHVCSHQVCVPGRRRPGCPPWASAAPTSKRWEGVRIFVVDGRTKGGGGLLQMWTIMVIHWGSPAHNSDAQFLARQVLVLNPIRCTQFSTGAEGTNCAKTVSGGALNIPPPFIPKSGVFKNPPAPFNLDLAQRSSIQPTCSSQ
jgi:hypothetical protein